MAELTIIYGYRDREPTRVRRSLDSLARQTVSDFQVIFVDYGSCPANANAVRTIVENYTFARYIYNETRGWPWNRSHALNTGIKLVDSPYVMTTDVDMIFASGFIESVLAAHQRSDQVTHAKWHFLPRDFANWSEVEAEFGRHRLSPEAGLGGNMTVSTAVLHQIKGFDEYYRYWGVEDRDLYHRLTDIHGLQVTWLPDDCPECAIYHQWHPLSFAYHWPLPPRHFTVPASIWGQANIHYIQEFKQAVRNSQGWGQIYTTANRLAADYVDFDHGQMMTEPTLVYDVPYSDVSRGKELMTILYNMKPRESILIPHGKRPEKYRLLTHMIRLTNRGLKHLGTEIDYSHNALHDFLAWFLLADEQLSAANRLVADYYLGLQQHDNASLLIRSKNTPMADGQDV